MNEVFHIESFNLFFIKLNMPGTKMSNSSKGRSQGTTSKNSKSSLATSVTQIQGPAGPIVEYESFMNSPAYIKIQDNCKLLPHYSVGKLGQTK